MVNNSAMHLDLVFGALSHPARRALLERVSLGEITITELADPFAMSLPAVSKHIKVLEKAGLIECQNQGRKRICSLKPSTIENAAEWFEYYRRFWSKQFDSLEEYLENEED